MAVNYVKGQILSGILERDGIDIAIANANVGINTITPTVALDVNGNIRANNLTTAGVIFATSANLANLHLANTTITTDGTVANIFIQPTGNGIVSINATTGLILPVGNTAQRPDPATTGTTRYNTATSLIEVYTGNAWSSASQPVTNQVLYGNGTATTFTLDRSTTTAAVLVILNGITQAPDHSYSMVPSPSINLVFTEAPQTSDIIDIRFL